MLLRKPLFIWCAVLGLAACQSAGSDPDDHCTGKCDDPTQSLSGQLMPRAPEAPGGISIHRSDQEWSFAVLDGKADAVLFSEAYASRANALNGMLSVEENGVQLDRYSVVEGDGGFRVELRAGNNEVIAESSPYASESEALGAIESAQELIAKIVQHKAALIQGAKFELFKDSSKWSFQLFDEDGQPLLVSQVYSRRRDALTGIESVRTNGKIEARYVVLDSPARFILKASNGQEIAESGMTFATIEDAEQAANDTMALLQSERVANPW